MRALKGIGWIDHTQHRFVPRGGTGMGEARRYWIGENVRPHKTMAPGDRTAREAAENGTETAHDSLQGVLAGEGGFLAAGRESISNNLSQSVVGHGAQEARLGSGGFPKLYRPSNETFSIDEEKPGSKRR